MTELIDTAELKRLAEAWQTEITTPGHYATDAYEALSEGLMGDGPSVVLALVEAVEAAQAVNAAELAGELEHTWSRLEATQGQPSVEWSRLEAALARFVSGRQTWYFTFGMGQKNAGRYYVVKDATSDEARDLMLATFGREWAFQYSEAQWHDEDGMSQAEKWGLVEIT